ncbi:MAG: ATP-binding protein [Bryobacteraceae bacterium]
MQFVDRAIAPTVLTAAKQFPALVLTGPRQSGKTTLLRRLFSRAEYVLLEAPDVQARAKSDPRGLLDAIRPPVLFDEIQNAPELFGYIRERIDARPRAKGQWLFTGSQEAPLMLGVAESMAGRAAIFQLSPFSLAETPRAGLLVGGYPGAVGRPSGRELWFASYVQTYLERDVRAVTQVRDLSQFRRFLALVASRHGQILNKTDLAAPLCVSVPTVGEWLDILEVTGQILIVPPYFRNFGRRLLKSPKVYLADSGLACYLLGIRTQAELERSPFLGALFEGFIGAEIVKAQWNAGRRKEIYHFRDQQGLEVDFLFPSRRGLWMVECKAAKTLHPGMTAPLAALGRSVEGDLRRSVVHRRPLRGAGVRALAPGIEGLDELEFVELLKTE